MDIPVKIELQGDDALERARPAIAKYLDDLGKRFGRIIACRVALKSPSGHHKTGGLYEITVHLTLPNGRDVDIDRTPPLDERHSDLMFALNDAFKRARRRLQDQARRLQ